MLLAGAAGRKPARRRRRLRRRARARARRRRDGASSGSRSPAPASSTSSSPTPGTGGRCAAWPPPASELGPRADASRRSGSWSSSSPPTRPGRCTSAAAATRPTATRWCGCWSAVGHEVEREYYVNDGGGQIERFAALDRRPDDRRGAARGRLQRRLRRRARRADRRRGDRSGRPRGGRPPRGSSWSWRRSGRRSSASASASTAGSPSASSTPSGEVEEALAQLEQGGHTYRSEGALWLRTTEFGDDKDRVLIRSNGEPTYLAADVAYHWDKLRARLRAPDRRARRRPPRLRRPAARRDRRRSAPTPTASRR